MNESQAPRRESGTQWTKLAIILALLAAIAWVGLLSLEYAETREPITRLETVPAPLTRFVRNEPRYLDSVYGVAVPLGVAIDRDGTLVVTESGGDRMIRRFGRSGEPRESFAPPGTDVPGRVPVYVAIGPDGNVYVTDRLLSAVLVYDDRGEFVRELSNPFDEAWQPLGVSFDAEGNLYVTDVTPGRHRIVVIAPNGDVRLAFGTEGTGPGEFYFPNAVVADRDGRIYVSDGNNGRVQVFDRAGNFLASISRGMGEGDLSLPRGLAIDEDQRLLFVVDASRGQVQVYDIAGASPRFNYSFGASGAPGTEMAFPNGVAVDGAGTVYVTDRENGRVQVWRY